MDLPPNRKQVSPTSAPAPVYGPATLDQFDLLPEDNTHRYELIDGRILVSSRPRANHQVVLVELLVALRQALPAGYLVVPEVEVEFDDRHQCTVPDLLVIRPGVDRDVARFFSRDLALSIEIVSPGSKRLDRQTKRRIYAEGQIPAYWVVETDPFSITIHQLVDGWYQLAQVFDGDELVVTGAIEMKLDLSAARRATLDD
ncbi:Uma2 family endonuclease [Cryptosporangium phraense]|uniref:Uma2 family endonuclease n=1 Tax=Cryptosporangium phraense TaxID=2593070 RepID=A0A545AU99_9ACTN|nr:Uma2 family endonuclease [Cryptosporangium phraense]TQS44902.1 Uma2 family endonuclease [Cryptosporangium phraense]